MSVSSCTFAGCDKPVHAKKLCNTHWRRLLRNGDLETHWRGNTRGRVDWANLPADDPRHGQAGTYTRGCRCDRCRVAAREYKRAWLANGGREYNRAYQRNYYRSLAQLRNNHDPEFRDIHSEMKAHAH